MTQKEKQLLLKDLCGRLPYGVMVHFEGWNPEKLSEVNLNEDVYNGMGGLPIPYLRPMSSMTEEEEKEFNEIIGYKGVDVDGCTRCDNVHTMYGIYIPGISNLIDWLLAHHFDYRGLIPMGLALEAKEGMYKTE